MKKAILASAILLAAVSCQSGDEPLFSIQAFLTADKGTLYGDFGESYIPASNPGVNLNEGRYFVTGYATEDLGNKSYKLTISNIAETVLDTALVNSEIPDQELVGYDAIQPLLGYAGGKYLNLRIEYLYKDETVKHTYDLVFDDANSNKDTLYFDLRHQANKDTLAVGVTMNAYYNYTSFDISKHAPQDKHSMVLTLRNKWYKTGASGYIPEKEDNKYFLSYTY